MAKQPCEVEGIASDMPADLVERVTKVGGAIRSLMARTYAKLKKDPDAQLGKGLAEFLDVVEQDLLSFHRPHMRDRLEAMKELQRSLNDLSYEGRRIAREFIDRIDRAVKRPGEDVTREVERRRSEGDAEADARSLLNEMAFMYLTRGDAGNEFGRLLGEDVAASADVVRQHMDLMGQTLANLDLISADSAAKYRSRYLRQLWEGDARPDIVAIKEALGLEVTQADLARSEMKRGGSSPTPLQEQRTSSVSPAAKGALKQRSFTIVSDAEYRTIPEGERDGYTLPYRTALEFGFQGDVRRLVAKGMAQETRLISVESILRHLGDESKGLSRRFTSGKDAAEAGYSPLLVSGLAFEQHLRRGLDNFLDTPAWKTLKEFKIKDESEGGAGESSGNLYVYTPVANEMNEFLRMASGLKNWADKFMVPGFRAWKEAKTVWNVPTHGRNIFGNMILLGMSDRYTIMAPGSLGLGRVFGLDQRNIFSEVGRVIKTTGGKLEESPLYRRAVQAGAISPRHVSLSDYIAYDEGTGFAGWKEIVEKVKGNAALEAIAEGAGRAREAVLGAYNWEDQVFRLAIFEDHVRPIEEGGLGLSDKDAAAAVDRLLPNYEQLPNWVKKANRYAVPFLGFFAEAGRIVAGHGWRGLRAIPDMAAGRLSPQQAGAQLLPMMRLALYGSALHLLHEAALSNAGYTEEEIDLLNRNTRGFQVFLPNPLSGDRAPISLNLTYTIPFMDQIYPMNEDPTTLPYGGDSGILGAAQRGGKLAVEMATANPFLRQATDLLRNQQFFTGQEIWKDTDGQLERWMNVAKYLFLQNVPSSIAGYQMQKMIQAMRGTENLSRTGPKYTVPQQLASLTGLQVQASSLADAIASERIRFSTRIRSLEGDIVRTNRHVASKRITPEQGRKITTSLREKIKALVEEQKRLR